MHLSRIITQHRYGNIKLIIVLPSVIRNQVKIKGLLRKPLTLAYRWIHSVYFLKMIAALWPPNPKVLDKTAFTSLF